MIFKNYSLFISKAILVYIFTFFIQIGFTQLPGEAGNFDIRGNVYSGTPTSVADDWFLGSTGTGIGLIDESQTATWLSLTQTLPPAAGSNTPFFVRASHQQYELVNGVLQFQSLFARDYVNFNSLESGNVDQTVFIGGNKNGESPQGVWGIQTKTVLSKNDLVDNYVHLRRAGTSSADDMWLNIGLSVLGSGGNHFADVELIASDININAAGTGFVNSGNEEGKNAWTFDAAGNTLLTGDLIVGFAFSGPTVSDVEVRIWVSRDFYENGSPSDFTFGPEFDGSGTNSVYGYAQVVIPAGGFYAQGSSSTVSGPPWQTYNEETNPLTPNYGPGNFAELGINLSSIGVDPAISGGNACDAPVLKVVFKTRSSSSFTSQLKDLAGPYAFLGTPIIDTDFTPDTFNCVTPVIELKPDIIASIAYYIWSTIDGNIISSKTDSSHVKIDRPGTYILCAAPLEGCDLTCDTVEVFADPCAVNDIEQTLINTPVTGSLTLNDNAPPGVTFDVVTTPISGPSNGSIIINADGTYTYTPDPGFVGVDEVVYEICINSYSPPRCDIAILTIEVRDNGVLTNEAPNVQDDNFTTPIDVPVTSCLICNDSDPDGDELTINTAPVTTPLNGTVTINPDGTYTYVPNPGFVGVDEFSYEVCDDGVPQLCETAIVTITITDENPLNETYATDDANSVLEDGTTDGNVLGNDTDPEGDTQKGGVALITDVSNGTLILNADGIYTYTPTAEYTGPDQFVYQVCDDGSPVACDTATVYLTVYPQGPLAEDDINQTLVETPVSGNVSTNDTDGDFDNLVVNTTPVVGPTNGTIVLNADGSYTYTPNPGFTGTDEITYQTCDNTSPVPLCDEAVLTIEVRDNGVLTNEPPNAQDDAVTVEANGTVTSCLICNDSDPDGDNITVNTTPVSGPTNGTVTINPDGTYTYTPNADFTGTDEFTYEICDDGVPQLCETATVSITVTPISDDNVTYANDDANSVLEDGSVDGNVLGNDTDPEGDTQTGGVALITDVSNGTLVLNADGTYTYAPTAEYTGPDQFVYQVCDDGSPVACDTATVYLTVYPQGPLAKNDINQTTIDTPVSGNVSTNDTDGDFDNLVVNTTPLVGPANGTIVLNSDGSYTYTPNPGFTGTDEITYETCDNTSPTPLCEQATLTIEVNDFFETENNALVLQDDAVTVEANSMVSSCMVCNDHDPDGNNLIVNTTPVSGPTNGSVVINPDGTYTYTPNPDFVGIDEFIYEICDDGVPQLCETATVTITVTPISDDNVTYANDDATGTHQYTPVSGNVLSNDTDPEGDSQIGGVTLISDVSNGTLVLNADGTFTYTPDDEYNGPDQFIYQVCDDGSPVACDTATAYLKVYKVCTVVQLKALLEGPYLSGSTMSTTLNDNHLLPGQDKDLSPNFAVKIIATYTPFGQPYSAAPWIYSGNMGMNYGDVSSPFATGEESPYDADVVDWILVTVREADILPANNVWRCAGWIKSNGDISFPDDCGCLSLDPALDFYVMVEHRNHLGVLSPSPVNKLNGAAILDWDFTSSNSYQPVIRQGQKEVSTGIWAMFAANGEQAINTGAINSADQTVWKTDQNEINYLFGDFNLNVVANSQDETIWKNNQNTTSGVIFY